jgi:predicted HD phosphohydrolase
VFNATFNAEKDGNTLDNTLSNSAQPLSFYEITQREHSITSFIETYQNELPLFVA